MLKDKNPNIGHPKAQSSKVPGEKEGFPVQEKRGKMISSMIGLNDRDTLSQVTPKTELTSQQFRSTEGTI